MGKLYLRSTGELIKNCTEKEYLELAFSTPSQYAYTPDPPQHCSIQDLNDFANRNIARNITNNDKKILDQKKSKLTTWSEICCIIGATVAFITFIVWILKAFFNI